MPMSTVKEIESAISSLSFEEKQAVRDWLDKLIEDQLEVSDEFKAKFNRARQQGSEVVMTPELERLLDEGLENLAQSQTTDELRRRS
jgi:hypothetical protein